MRNVFEINELSVIQQGDHYSELYANASFFLKKSSHCSAAHYLFIRPILIHPFLVPAVILHK